MRIPPPPMPLFLGVCIFAIIIMAVSLSHSYGGEGQSAQPAETGSNPLAATKPADDVYITEDERILEDLRWHAPLVEKPHAYRKNIPMRRMLSPD